MRISDWSSDVCSSDLIAAIDIEESAKAAAPDRRRVGEGAGQRPQRRVGDTPHRKLEQRIGKRLAVGADQIVAVLGIGHGSAEIDADILHRPHKGLYLDTSALHTDRKSVV